MLELVSSARGAWVGRHIGDLPDDKTSSSIGSVEGIAACDQKRVAQPNSRSISGVPKGVNVDVDFNLSAMFRDRRKPRKKVHIGQGRRSQQRTPGIVDCDLVSNFLERVRQRFQARLKKEGVWDAATARFGGGAPSGIGHQRMDGIDSNEERAGALSRLSEHKASVTGS